MGTDDGRASGHRHIELPCGPSDGSERDTAIAIDYHAGPGNWSGRIDSRRGADDGCRCYTLVVVLRGCLRVRLNPVDHAVEERDYLLLGDGLHCDLQASGQFAVGLITIPHALLSAKLISVADHIGPRFPRDRQMALFLADFTDSVIGLFHAHRPSRPQALAAQLINCVAMVVGSEIRDKVVDVRGARYTLRRRITDCIEAHIRDETLTPAKVAGKCGISVSYLYALLRDDGVTLGHFVHKRRLDLAYEILAGDIKKHRTVADVAYEVGFKNVSHFSRSFSQRFHCPPRDVRNASGTR